MPDRLPFPGESWDNVGSNLHRGAIRSVCGSVPRNGCFRGYHTNTARGESKTPISRNRGEIGGKAREHIPRELIERDSKNGFYLGRRFDRRKWRDVPILETRTHNPKVVGSNPAPATKTSGQTHSLAFFYCLSPWANHGQMEPSEVFSGGFFDASVIPRKPRSMGKLWAKMHGTIGERLLINGSRWTVCPRFAHE